jgi:hypothetical protein
VIRIALAAILVCSAVLAAQAPTRSDPRRRVLLDAHNAYPYQGRWADRVDRALATGLPLAIEQDLLWRPASGTEPSHSIVSHGEPFTGHEPTLRDFFEHVRPIVTRALQSGSREDWPIITVNLDFKDHDSQHFKAIWRLLDDYEPWLTTALQVADERSVQPLDIKPVLVLTGADPAQAAVFHQAVPVGSRLRLFGAVPPGSLKKTNYLRWSNNPWSVVEPESQNKAGDWSESDAARLDRLVDAAHDAGLWIRFYTLNGHPPEEGERMGWSAGYNFMSIDAARIRWRAAIDAGVDFIATDQYEEMARATSRR